MMTFLKNLNNSYKLKKRKIKQDNIDFQEIANKDFYPPEDNRCYHCEVCDIENGDNFNEYAKLFFYLYEKELFDD